ncbi:MAG: hypothetical protein IT461_00105 [Planctomycetes bacterium]|nr:hypothetical protein [Planctomycetota bacterium]
MRWHVLGCILCVLACASAVSAYDQGTAEYQLWKSIDENFTVNKGPPPQLVSTNRHGAFRNLDQEMATAGFNGTSEVRIDNFPCDDDKQVLITIIWKRGSLTKNVQGILIATTPSVTSGNVDTGVFQNGAICTQLCGESSAYADGGDNLKTDDHAGNAGKAKAIVEAPSSYSWSCGGISSGAAGGTSTALARVGATSSKAEAYQSMTPSWQGAVSTATAKTTNSSASAYGGDSSGTASGASTANNGAAASATATDRARAHGGVGAKGTGAVNGGTGGASTANGGMGTTSTGGKGGDQTGGTGTPGAGGIASGNGTNTNGTDGNEV